jgi:hypothetical protein
LDRIDNDDVILKILLAAGENETAEAPYLKKESERLERPNCFAAVAAAAIFNFSSRSISHLVISLSGK